MAKIRRASNFVDPITNLWDLIIFISIEFDKLVEKIDKDRYIIGKIDIHTEF